MTVRIKKVLLIFLYLNNFMLIIFLQFVVQMEGKSTALMEIDKIFSIYPFNLKNFHHSDVGNKKRTNITKLKIKKLILETFIIYLFANAIFF